MAFKTPGEGSPLTEAELDRLEEFLNRCKEKDNYVMGLEELDGFLAAIMVGPEIVMPSEYLEELFGEDASPFETEEEAAEILELIFRLQNMIADTLKKDEPYVPIFTEFEGDLPLGNQWAHGFLRGADFSRKAWGELMENEEHGGCVLPMLILANEHNPDPELRPSPEPMEKRQDILVHMAAGVVFAYRYFKEQRKKAAEAMRDYGDNADYFADEIPLQVTRSEPKTGRNHPCPCGSGKKYKRCHGAVAVQ